MSVASAGPDRKGCDVRGEQDLVRRLVQGWQHEHRSEVAEALIADDFVDRSARPGEQGTRQDGITFLK